LTSVTFRFEVLRLGHRQRQGQRRRRQLGLKESK
jgi:hypothetical protein